MCEIKDKAHHSIMVMTGARNQKCCPECGSADFYVNKTFDQLNTIYDDGHVEVGYMDYCDSMWLCYDCDYGDGI